MKRNITDSEAALWRKADEKKKLIKFASKITKVPELLLYSYYTILLWYIYTFRVYTTNVYILNKCVR